MLTEVTSNRHSHASKHLNCRLKVALSLVATLGDTDSSDLEVTCAYTMISMCCSFQLVNLPRFPCCITTPSSLSKYSTERLHRLTRIISLRIFEKMNYPDRSTGFETSLPSEACNMCSILRAMFKTEGFFFRASLETLETTCSGHAPLFDFLRDEISKKLSESHNTWGHDMTNNVAADAAPSRTGKSSVSTEDVSESDKRKQSPKNGRDQKQDIEPYETWSLTVSREHYRLEINLVNLLNAFRWKPLIVRSCYEPQKPGFGRVLDPEWVDLESARRWKRDCFAQHNDKCRNPLRISTVSPAWVIDTIKRCIVPGASISEYVALSYRWGVSGGFRTTRHLLKAVQEPGALSQGSVLGNSMAPIVQHAMGLTRAIDERYLWVDAVCIVQDDEEHCATQLGLMGAIYATATLTIVASDGDAMDGILGLKGISSPRQIDQKIVPVYESDRLIFRCPPSFRSGTSAYFDRGWTYQEYHLSQRRLTFAKGHIYWHCSCADWEEDVIQPDDTTIDDTTFEWLGEHKLRFLYILQKRPDFKALNKMLSEYNGRNLSFPEDALPGISGLLSVLSRSFENGFLFGLPEIAFDSALLWRSPCFWTMKKREDSGKKNLLDVASRLPSWSWVSWKGANFHVLDEETFASTEIGESASSWTIPITQWFTHGAPEAIEKRRIDSDWFGWREKFSDITCELPEGWTREENDGTLAKVMTSQIPDGLGQYLYRHAAIPFRYFWLPVPIISADEGKDLLGPAQTPYISCNTKRGRFDAAKFPISQFSDREREDKCDLFHVGLLDSRGNYCGRLYLQGPDDILHFPEADSGRTCDVEIVAICRRREIKSRQNSWRIDGDEKENIRFQRDAVFKDVYGVLWVEWIDGVAYRKASGVVDKDAWEGYDLEDVHLVMG